MNHAKTLCTALSLLLFAGVSPLRAEPATRGEPSAPAPTALVMQVVGLTEIRVEYASPPTRGRKALAEFFPADTVSPLGAQAPARLSVGRDVQVGGKTLAAGAYGLFLSPEGKRMNLVMRAEGPGHSDGADVARISLARDDIPARERMTFIFSDTTETRTRLDIEWGTTRLSFPIEIDPTATSNAVLEAHVRDSWRVWAGAARICLELGELDEARAVIEASLAMKTTWLNLWIKAQIHAAREDHLGAYAAAERALALGLADPNFTAKGDIERSLVAWRAKALP